MPDPETEGPNKEKENIMSGNDYNFYMAHAKRNDYIRQEASKVFANTGKGMNSNLKGEKSAKPNVASFILHKTGKTLINTGSRLLEIA